jgi:hypothetical protein
VNLTQWGVYVVFWSHDGPNAENDPGKQRPAVLASDQALIDAGALHFIKVSTLASHDGGPPAIHLSAARDGAEFAVTGLTRDSWIYYTDWQLVPQDEVMMRIGYLGPDTAEFLQDMITGAMG